MFSLGQKSLDRLNGVHPDLVRVVKRAIGISAVDFGISEGLRSREKQQAEVAAGRSRTMDSRHLTGHAVDMTAYLNGKPSWDWPLYGQLALAMKQAAAAENVPLRWGGVWDRDLAELGDNPYQDHLDYVTRFETANPGKKALSDGPHFELTRQRYP